jgi:hypothetical protein
MVFTAPNGTHITIPYTTARYLFIFDGIFGGSFTPDAVGTWSVSAYFAGDSTYNASSVGPTTFVVTALPQYTVSFRQTGAGVAPTVTYHIGSGTNVQGTVPFDVQVNQGNQITYTYQSPVPGATGTQYVLTGTSPTSPQTITANLTITGTYKTQYQVTFAVTPIGSGTTTPSIGTPWCDAGSNSISATSNIGYAFSSWSSTGSITITNTASASTTATISGPGGTITATFATVTPHYVDTDNAVHDTNVGTHSSFPAMQAGPDGTYDTLTESATIQWLQPSGSTYDGQDSSHPASYSRDSDTSSYWRYSQNQNHWIVYDMGASYAITQVEIYQGSTTLANEWGYGGSVNVYVSNSATGPWTSATLVLTGWSPADGIAGWHTSLTFTATGRYIRLEEVGCSSQSTHRLYEFQASTNNYQLDLEAQFAGVTAYQQYTHLQIQTGAFSSPAETITVYYWTGTSWTSLGTLTANSLNTFTVSLTGTTYQLRFVDGTRTSDYVQSSWQIDSVCLVG